MRRSAGRRASCLRSRRFSAMLWSSMRLAARLASLGLFALIFSGAPLVQAQGKHKPAPRAAKAKKAPAKAEPEPAEPAPETKSEAPAGAPEGAVKAAGTKEAKDPYNQKE